MKKQKICIIGDGLAGLTTALTLKNLDLDIDLFYKKGGLKSKKDNRTTAVSDSNYQFLKKNLKLNSIKQFWACKKVELFYQKEKKIINFLNLSEENKSLMHIFKNDKFKNTLIKQIKKEKKIKFIGIKSISINPENCFVKYDRKTNHYDLIILCTGRNSSLYRELNINRSISKDYKEIAITGEVTHNSNIINASQYFFKEGPFAILPFQKKKFSFVWSLNKDYYNRNLNNLKFKVFDKLDQIKNSNFSYRISAIESFPIYLNLKTRYFKKNVLILGEGIHTIHPVAGQGFNLVIRDIIKLYNLIKKNTSLGIQIKNSHILGDFYQVRKSENTLFGIGIDLTNNFFKHRMFVNQAKNILLDNIKKYNSLKILAKKISDKGFFA